MDRDSIDESEVGQLKLKCLKLAVNAGAGGEDDIIKAAQKFWDFILKSDETPEGE